MRKSRQGKYTKPLSRTSKVRRASKRRFAWWRKLPRWKKIALIVGPILAFLILVPLLTYLYYANDIADKERLMNRNNTGIVLLDKDGEAFYSVGRAEHRDLVPLEDISPQMTQALIASEDKNFYEHPGFSVISIGQALFTNISSGDINAYGGSTLTQQLAKNTLLSNEKTFLRKYQELAISIAIEQQYSKDEILEMYLNSVYFGENAFGIKEAADVYFNEKPSELGLAQSAMLVGVLPAPSAYSPISGSMEYAKERQETVLSRMVENGKITQAEADKAYDKKLDYAKQKTKVSIAPHFAEMVIQNLSEEYGNEVVMRSGYQVKTTLDTSMQKTLQGNIDANMAHIRANGGSNAGAVAIDPNTGQIRALVGSADYTNKEWGKVNMALNARQPGSSFKPIYYSGALAEGVITPATILHDKPINIDGYQPQNADRQFRGEITVRSALSQSLNIPSIEVMQKYGINSSIEQAHDLGISAVKKDQDYGLSLALGSAEVPLMQMTNAYAAFANEGQQYDPTSVLSVKDKYGNEIYNDKAPRAEQAVSRAGAFLISDILSDNEARAPMFGSALTVFGENVAVKTGTTDDSRDAWTIGYSPSLAVGVWVGNNNNDPMLNGGSSMAGPIWRNTMSEVLAERENQPFARPDSVVTRATCYSNHGIATNDITEGTYKEFYLTGALPSKTCSPEKPEPIEVCVLESKDIKEIEEDDFDSKLHSKNLDKCKEEEPEVTMIEVCELATGQVVTIKKDEFNPQEYSRDTQNCQPPEDGNNNGGDPGQPPQPGDGPLVPPTPDN